MHNLYIENVLFVSNWIIFYIVDCGLEGCISEANGNYPHELNQLNTIKPNFIYS